MYYWWMYSFGENPIAVDGVYYEPHIVMTTVSRHTGQKDLEHGHTGSESEAARASPL